MLSQEQKDFINSERNKLKYLVTQIRKSKEMLKQDSRYGTSMFQEEMTLRKEKKEYRHRHIAFCLEKGTPYEKIEPVVKEGNEPNWDLVEKYQKPYMELRVQNEEIVRSA